MSKMISGILGGTVSEVLALVAPHLDKPPQHWADLWLDKPSLAGAIEKEIAQAILTAVQIGQAPGQVEDLALIEHRAR